MIAKNYPVCAERDEENTRECWNCKGEGHIHDQDNWEHTCIFCYGTGKQVMLEESEVIKGLLAEIAELKRRIEKLEVMVDGDE